MQQRPSEQRLTVGNVAGAVRVGDTVRRPAGPWTPTVHALLDHLRARGFSEAPRPLGIDEEGREVLGYVEGDVPSDVTLPHTDEALAEVARLIRRFHDASEGFAPQDARWQALPGIDLRHEVICHNDLAPYNTVYESGRPVAIIDWDYAAPGTRTWDIAHAAWRYIPLSHDRPAERSASRLRLFCDAYGLRERADLLDVIARRQQALHDTIREFAARGIPAFVAMWNTEHSEEPLRDREHLLAHRTIYELALE